MKTEILHKKLERYLNGEALPAETRQIQSWLSVTQTEAEPEMNESEKDALASDILNEIRQQTGYPTLYPKQDQAWWQKAMAAFF